MDAKKEKYYRSVILQHLGRLSEKYPNQEETIIQIAQNICKERMNTNKAIEYINEVRNKAGENFAENKVEGTFKKIVRVFRDANLEKEDVSMLIDMLAKLKITELTNK